MGKENHYYGDRYTTPSSSSMIASQQHATASWFEASASSMILGRLSQDDTRSICSFAESFAKNLGMSFVDGLSSVGTAKGSVDHLDKACSAYRE